MSSSYPFKYYYDDKVWPLVYGSNVVLAPKYAFIRDNQSTGDWRLALVLSNWEISSISQLVYRDTIQDSAVYSLVVTNDDSDVIAGSARLPILSYATINAVWSQDQPNIDEKVFCTVNGIKHYNYDSAGEAQDYDYKHTDGSNAVTNPVWVAIHLLMNELGLEWSRIDFASAYSIACDLSDEGYSIRLSMQKPRSITEVMKLILGACSVNLVPSAGKLKFKRLFAADSGDIDYALSAVTAGTLKVNRVDELSLPTEFSVKYQFSGANNSYNYQYEMTRTLRYEAYAHAYGQAHSQEIDLSALDDMDGTESGMDRDDSVTMLQALVQSRRALLSRETYTLTTPNLMALLLEPYDLISLTVSTGLVDASAALFWVQSVSRNGGDVQLVLEPHNADWWNPDVDAVIGSPTTLTFSSPGDFPAYRFLVNSGVGAGAATIQLKSVSGSDVDMRALQPGMAVWAANTGTADYADPSEWNYVGIIDSVSARSTTPETALVTLAANSLSAITTNWRVQIQPALQMSSGNKMGNGAGQWQCKLVWPMPGWSFATNSPGEYAADASFYVQQNVGWQTVDNPTNETTDWLGSASVPLPYDSNGYQTRISTASSPPTFLPCAFRFPHLNRRFIQDTTADYIYAFCASLTVHKEYAQLVLAGEWNEIFGVSLTTDWDDEEQSGIHSFVVKYSTSEITTANFESAGSLYEGPPFKFKTLNSAALRLAEFNTTYWFGLKTKTADGDYSDDGTGENFYALEITKLPKLWENFTGTLNRNASVRGAGFLTCTDSWIAYVGSQWETLGSEYYAGGWYCFSKYRGSGTYGIDKWRRYSLSGATLYANGPTAAIETTGDAKFAYWVNSGTLETIAYATGTPREFGVLLQAQNGDANARGRYLFGLSKTYGTMPTWSLTGTGYSYGLSTAMGTSGSIMTGISNYRGAALIVADSNSGYDNRAAVFAASLGVYALHIGAAGTTFPLLPTNSSSTRTLLTAPAMSWSNSEPFLTSFSKSGTDQWHTYPFFSSASGKLHIGCAGYSSGFALDGYALPVVVRKSNSYGTNFWIPMSNSSSWAVIPSYEGFPTGSIPPGAIVFNATLSTFYGYNGSSWQALS